MKADDDAFVNVPALTAELKANCVTPGCRRERMYFGREIRNNVVRQRVGRQAPHPGTSCCLHADSCHTERSHLVK